VNDEFERMWKEAVVAYLDPPSWQYPRGTDDFRENLSWDIRCHGLDSKQTSPEYKSEALPPKRASSVKAA
jgi:hypothetical protein